MNTVDRVKSLCKERGVPISRLEKACGFANGYIGQLKKVVFRLTGLQKSHTFLKCLLRHLWKKMEKTRTLLFTAKKCRH